MPLLASALVRATAGRPHRQLVAQPHCVAEGCTVQGQGRPRALRAVRRPIRGLRPPGGQAKRPQQPPGPRHSTLHRALDATAAQHPPASPPRHRARPTGCRAQGPPRGPIRRSPRLPSTGAGSGHTALCLRPSPPRVTSTPAGHPAPHSTRRYTRAPRTIKLRGRKAISEAWAKELRPTRQLTPPS
ncbi:hypothetical protein NDU88_001936 [Pleurodeles waltl]|uniref:Uncharacterized protein n=1 Tax=Pleurodeles waltl TaxID=8319 RepID=A0AAV7RE91_PLEWA|nr:hypothetical protein NDU88_001936 [Pleurodeles waltl]